MAGLRVMKIPGKDDGAKRFITIGGGKGGVGKSLVASNLSLAMAQAGSRVVLVDCDLGAANQHVLFGIDRPKPGIQGLLDHKIGSLEEGLTPTAHPNLQLVAGTGASVGAANINHGEKQRIIRRIRALDAQVIIIDVGAGVSFNVLDFFELGSQRLLVITPQVTSIQTAYSFLKGAVMRCLQHLCEKASELDLLAPAAKSGENEKVSAILARVRDQSPVLGEQIDKVLTHFGAQIVGNQVFDANQAGIFHAITRMIQDFLGITVPILGTVRASRRIRESVNLRKPMMLGPRDEDTRAFDQMAEALLAEDVALDDLLAEDSAPHVADAAHDRTPVTAPRTSGTMPAITAAPEPGLENGVPATNGTADASADPVAAPSAAARTAAAVADKAAVPQPLLDPYMRRSNRYEIDWVGSLRGPDGIRPVRIFEVSEGGAVVQTPVSLELGQEMTLVFEQIPMQPQVPVKVSRRASLGFVVEGDSRVAVMTAATPPTPARRLAG
jgi:flagellar biosynthesis protein FlhG